MPPDSTESSQTAISTFAETTSELTSLIVSTENLLRQYREQEPRFPINPDEENLSILCGYRSVYGGNFSQLEARMNNKLADSSYTSHADYEITIDDLGQIIDEDRFSLPMVELHPDYYEKADYVLQPGQYGKSETPILIPVAIDEGQVIYWDPYVDFYHGGTDSTKERAISDTNFITLWNEAEKTNWTYWIDRAPQQTLPTYSR